MKRKKKGLMRTIGIVSLVFIFWSGMASCKDDPPLSNITVSNECGLGVDVFMDGVFQFYVEFGFMKTIKDLEWGIYSLEARRKSTGQLVVSEDINVRINEEFIWHVWSSASIQVTNLYGELVSIYGDNVYVGDLEDQDTSMMDHVPYGNRKLEAKLSDGTVVASTTISVLEDFVYTWTVEK